MARGLPSQAGAVTLQPDDLVDDREVGQLTDDRLAHVGIVDQLAALATTVETPSNIALYGPWGSGKSGIANLLKAQIDGKDGTRFVRFDAFKYADVPLRRNFISALANELGRTDRKYHADLYSGHTTTDISVPPSTLAKLIGAFAVLLATLTAILGAVVLVVAFIQSRFGHDEGGFGSDFRALSKQVVLAGLLPAALLAAFISLASKTFSVDRSLAKPDSDEQFEKLFRELVAATGAKRLVVFVDELDRCSPNEVVATLDTVRTFLGIERCVFVIAADQNVLEAALTKAAKQETPADDANPYYSTGSAYLDKVFQYQLSLPPLLAQSVSNYAATLVEGRGGLWADINKEYVLSVLVPTHVASPRRVKHLLNTFALTYRLAEERHRTELLSEDPATVAASIARLVCLRVEFPLFARHLQIDANLPNLVLQLLRDPDAALPAGTSERAEQLARSYALEAAAPGNVLLSKDLSKDADPDDNDDSDAGSPEDTDDTSGPTTQTVTAHNKQLLNYLRRTGRVPGPTRDLIYMHSGGAVFGLDGELALVIEQAAEDGDIETLKQRISRLDEAGREGALQLLAHQVHTGTGITGPNTARSFLLLTEELQDLSVGSVADSVAEAICIQHDEAGNIVDEETASSAWRLAKAGSESGAMDLRRRVLAAATNPEWEPRDFLFDDALSALAAAPQAVAAYFATRLASEGGPEAAARLFTLSDDDLIQVLDGVGTHTATSLAEAARAHQAWKKATEEATDAAATTAAQPNDPSQSVGARDPGEEPFNPRSVLETLAETAADRETAVQHAVLRLLLATDTVDGRASAFALIGKTEPTADSGLITNILKAVQRQGVATWPAWLNGVDRSAISAHHAVPIDALVLRAWNNKWDLGRTHSALEALHFLIEGLPHDARPDITTTVIEEIGPDAVTSNEDATARREVLRRAQIFAEEDMLDYGALMSHVAQSLQATLAEPIAGVSRDEPLYQYLMQEGADALTSSASILDTASVNGVIQEAADSPWLDDLGHVEVALELAHAVGSNRVTLDALPNAKTLADVVHNWGTLASHAATRWVELTQPGPEELAVVYERLNFEGALTEDLLTETRRAQNGWTDHERRAFLDKHLADPRADVPGDLALRVIGIDTADAALVTDLLCARFRAAHNNNQRQAVITLWSKAKINDDACRRRLIETTVYGLLELHTESTSNIRAVEIALNALRTLGSPLPSKIKGALGKRVEEATRGTPTLEAKALDVMPGLGYPIKGGRFRGKKVKYDDGS